MTKKLFTLLFVGGMLTFAACQSKPKTEETSTTETTTMSSDTMAMDSASSTMATDSMK